MVEAIQHQPAGSPPRELKDSIIDRRGSEARNIAKVAAARKLLTCVFYAMRDGEVRSLAAAAAQQRPGEQARTRAARDRLQVWPPPPGGAAAALIDPAARTRTAPCPRGRQPREPRRDDRSQAPATDKAAPWGRNTTTHRRPFPPPHYRNRGRAASRTPAGAAAAARAPPGSLTPAARSPGMAAIGNSPHQGPCPPQVTDLLWRARRRTGTGKKGHKIPLDTGSLLQG